MSEAPAGMTASIFLSTPSARRATQAGDRLGHDAEISIHALREEGDVFGVPGEGLLDGISIHALREEGDSPVSSPVLAMFQFLSTPSARRATLHGRELELGRAISIHALREEGDTGLRGHSGD